MKKSRKNRLLCILLSLAMVLTLLPGMSLTAYADAGDILPESDYLTFTAEENDSVVSVEWYRGSNMTYSLNDGSWQTYNAGTQISLNIGDSVRFRGSNITFDFDNHFSITGEVAGSGNVMSLRLDEDSKEQGLADYCFSSMFSECSGLTKAPDLPARTLAEGCYQGMFLGCTGLTEAPALPATTLAEGCYASMFEGCTGLTEAPALPATDLAIQCYSGMFSDCSGLTEAPALPATVLAIYCYSYMFNGCSGLTKAPDLPATTLADGCYGYMFNGCIGLTEAPDLPATDLPMMCYYHMFSGCRGIEFSDTQTDDYWYEYTIPAGNIPAENVGNYALEDMFSGITGIDSTPTAGKKYYMKKEVDPKLPDGKYAQTATVDNVNYTRYVYVLPLSALDGKKKATFTVTKGSASKEFETNTYYTGVTSSGITYVPASEGSVMLVCTIKGAKPNELTCTLKIDGEEYSPTT